MSRGPAEQIFGLGGAVNVPMTRLIAMWTLLVANFRTDWPLRRLHDSKLHKIDVGCVSTYIYSFLEIREMMLDDLVGSVYGVGTMLLNVNFKFRRSDFRNKHFANFLRRSSSFRRN